MNIPSKKVFISYAHKDSDFFHVFEEGLKNHLFNSNKFNFGIWEDTKIHPGSFWDDEIQDNLSQSDIAILCVSAAFLNSQYIQAKEFSVLIDRFPGTLIVPIYFNHCNINAWDDLSKRQFFKPSGKKFDKAYKADFAFCDLVGFIHTDGRPLPNSNIELYFKELVSKIELSIEEKRKPIKNEENKSEVISYSLVPKPTNLFTGRKKELKDFDEQFIEANIICIAGLGGTGKSEFAARYIENLNPENVVWFDCKSDSLFESLIECAGYFDLLKVENKTLLALFLGFKDLIERDCKILFLDNYHNIKDEQFELFFKFLKNSLQKAKIILISREKFLIDDIDITHFPLDGLNDDSVEYAKKIIKKNYEGIVVITDEKLKIICDDLVGHPFAIQLAMQLLSYEGNDFDILNCIKNYSIENNKLSSRLLDEIFNHPKSTHDEKELLKTISVFRGKMEKKAIEFILGKEYKSPLKNLINKLMVDQKAGNYILHPLVKEFSYEKLEKKKEIHKLALKYYLEINAPASDLTIQEEIFYHFQNAEEYHLFVSYVEQNADTLLDYGYVSLIKQNIEILFSLGFKTQKLVIILVDTLSLMGGEVKNMLPILKEVYLLPLQSQEILIEAKITEAELLVRISEVDNVLIEFSNLLNESRSINFQKGESVCLSSIGTYYHQHNELKMAEISYLEALSISEPINYYKGIQNSLTGLGYTYYLKEKFQKAYDQYLKKITYAEKVNNINDISHAINGFALIHSEKGEYDEALKLFNESLHMCIEKGDKYGQASRYHNIADVLRRQGKMGFDDILNKSLNISKELSDYVGMSDVMNLFGVHYYEIKDYYKSIESFIYSIGYSIKGKRRVVDKQISSLKGVKEALGIEEYLKFVNKSFSILEDDIKNNIDISEIQFKPFVAEKIPGRNDLCTCGSGKKYKNCHGKK